MNKPWISGPKELIKHAIAHLHGKSSDFDLRIAFISIDNGVEVMIKTYLGLPRRVKDIPSPTRRELESAFGFPDILDLLEKFAPQHLEGIELGEIEWYHRIRNSLYHDGNGITVEKKHVETYLGLAKILFENLFQEKLEDLKSDRQISSNEVYLEKWLELERRIWTMGLNSGIRKVQYRHGGLVATELKEKGLISDNDYNEILKIFKLRNGLAHGSNLSPDTVQYEMTKVQNLIDKFPDWRIKA